MKAVAVPDRMLDAADAMPVPGGEDRPPVAGPGQGGNQQFLRHVGVHQRAVKIDIERQGRRLMMRHILGQISVQIPQQSRSVAIFLRLRKTMVRKCADFLARRGFDCKKLRYVWQK